MTNKEKIKQMTFSEKAMLLTGKNMLTTAELDRLNIPSIEMADGPHGVRTASGKPCSIEGGCICFPTASAASAKAGGRRKNRYAAGDQRREYHHSQGAAVCTGKCLGKIECAGCGQWHRCQRQLSDGAVSQASGVFSR